jgi:hypothetical protein
MNKTFTFAKTMMIRRLILVASLVFAQPASACHRFAVWKYPTPQRCGVATHARVAPKAPAPAPVDDIRIDPILIPPGWDEEQERREALHRAEDQLELSQGGKQ